MTRKKKKGLSKFFNAFSGAVTKATGKPIAFILATLVIIIWAVSGPLFHFSDTWQLVINTSTTIITFLMVFVIQHSQNKDTVAIQLKLNELIAANRDASNRLIAIEELTEEELEVLKKFYTRIADLSQKEHDVFTTHSIDEAKKNSANKIKRESAITNNKK